MTVIVGEALKGIQKLCIETAPLIYYVEEHPVYIARMDAIFAPIKASLLHSVCSTIVLTEVLIQPLKCGNGALVREYRDILLNGETRLLPITAQVADLAAEIRARYNLRTADALHIASALDAGCDAFLTNDMSFKRVQEITILVLDELELDVP